MQGDRPWRVSFHREVAKIVAFHGIESDRFRPTLRTLIESLETNPKQFPKKSGTLKTCRAADVKFADGVTWRAVVTLDENAREIRVLALGPHDTAYTDAEKRL